MMTSRHLILSIPENYYAEHLTPYLTQTTQTASSTTPSTVPLPLPYEYSHLPKQYTKHKMSATEKDWEEKTAKWEDGINPTEVTKNELTNYLQYKMYIYIEIHNQLDLTLWELF